MIEFVVILMMSLIYLLIYYVNMYRTDYKIYQETLKKYILILFNKNPSGNVNRLKRKQKK